VIPRGTRPCVWLIGVALGLGACASSSERDWEKPGATLAVLEADESECLAAAGVQRRPQVHAGTAGIPGREGDFAGRGYEAYVTCMQAKGYTRPSR
jgi:hypothetical protein